MRRAQQLDPVSPAKLAELAQVFFLARRYDEAIEHCNRALELDPNLGFAHWVLGLVHMEKGAYETAIAELQRSIPLSGDSLDEPASLAIAYARSGRITDARKLLAELKHHPGDQYLSPTMLAAVHAALGENDEAFSLLDGAINQRDSMVAVLKVEPLFEPLRSDQRFATLLGRIGLN
jgi:tetratricopeptide (TPR) repeat protein